MHLSTMRKKCAGNMKFYLLKGSEIILPAYHRKPLNLKKQATYLGNDLFLFK
jgi:hypothetical protein